MVCSFKYKPQKWSVNIIVRLLISIFVCASLHFMMMRDIVKFLDNMTNVVGRARQQRVAESQIGDMKYILLWKNSWMSERHLSNCSVSNCIFTEDRDLLSGDYSRYHAIVFDESHLNSAKGYPTRRASSQIYIFTSIESSSNHPACELYSDDFFNWTFTYRLDSDVVLNYFTVRNISRDIVAPSETVQWNIAMHPVHKNIKAIFKGRTRAAAWLVSHCEVDSLRNEYLTRLQEHLFYYSLQIDVYGKCTKRKCDNNDCEEMLRNHYYFYMAFENSFADDYVTEKVLHGYDNYVVPIVYGGANYSRFLPPGSYINAREYHPYNLAHVINQAVKNAKLYEAFFHWTNSYTIDSTNHRPVCDLCKAMNSEKARYAPAKKEFRQWWNSLNGMKWCLPLVFWNETSKMNTDGSHIYKNIY